MNNSIRDIIFTEIKTKETESNPYYLGLSQDTYHGMISFGHGGFWGTVMLYFPETNSSISVCVLERDERALSKDVLDVMSRILRDNVKISTLEKKK